MCFMMDRGGEQLCYVLFPQCYVNNTIFFDVNMRALDGLQGPICVGTGCLFRRIALYGFHPPRSKEHNIGCCSFYFPQKHQAAMALRRHMLFSWETTEMMKSPLPPSLKNLETSLLSLILFQLLSSKVDLFLIILLLSMVVSLVILTSVPRELVDASTVAEALSVISCWYEDDTEWGQHVGWIYGSVTGDVVTGYKMQCRGWKSVYCVTKPEALRETAPSNLVEQLHQAFQWARGSVKIFSCNNALLASSRMKILQRIAYLNIGIYPFTSIFLVVYCFLPVLSLFTGQFIVQTLNVTFLMHLLLVTLTLCMLSILEIKWSGITFKEYWRNKHFWLIEGTSAHFGAMLQALLKAIAGVEISFPTWMLADDEFGDSYSSLVILSVTIMMLNLTGIAVGICGTIYSAMPQWSNLNLLGSVFFSFCVLAHLCSVAFRKG